MKRSIVFIVDLVQDVNTLRPVMALARRETAHDLIVIASSTFDTLDSTAVWGRELREICGMLAIPIYRFTSEFEAVQLLQGRGGLLISASELDARAHVRSHNLFRAVPSEFVRVTLQHGYECLGFLHNAAHDRRHWQYASFNADILCGWFGNGHLRSVSPDQAAKLIVTGPPLLIDYGNAFGPDDAGEDHGAEPTGGLGEEQSTDIPINAEQARPACLICENLHSVRLGTDVLKAGFIALFRDFAEEAAALGWDVWLRPHPAGLYSDIKGIALPRNVQKSSGPIYKENLSRFSFAISAPSSILFDFVLAEVPVAIWEDPVGSIDCRNYAGLPVVTHVGDWVDFAERAQSDRPSLMARQQDFIASLALPEDVTARYLDVLRSIN